MTRRVELAALLEDGPCAGSYTVLRTPHLLIATVGPGGEAYVLDEDLDEVSYGEEPFLYRAAGPFHLDGDGLAVNGRVYALAGRPVLAAGQTLRVPAGAGGRMMLEVEPCAPDELERWAELNRDRLDRLVAAGERRPAPQAGPDRQGALF